jgi:anti-sigma B factor antagonist
VAVDGGFDDGLVVDLLDRQGDATVIRLAGDIDMLTSQHLRAAVTEVLASTSGDVVFDMAGVDFVDSSGLSVLIAIAQAGRSVVLRSPTDVVRRVIETTGLTSLLPIEP